MADNNNIIVQPAPARLNMVEDEGLIDDHHSERTAGTPDSVDSKPGLGKIAAELHMHIAESLDKPGVLTLRQTCRVLARDTDDIFMRLFETRHVPVSMISLRDFYLLSRRSWFARRIKVIEIVIPHVQQRFPQFLQTVSGKTMTIHLKDLQLELRHSFKKLARLGAGRQIKIISSGGFNPKCSNIVYEALADSGHRVQALVSEADSRTWGWTWGSAVTPDFSPAQMDALRAPWSSLECLDLRFRCQDWEDDTRMNRILSRVLAGATQLQELHLRECPSFVFRNIQHYLTATALRRLSLSHIDTSQALFCRFLPITLEQLQLESVRLETNVEHGSWAEVLSWMEEHLMLTKLYAKNLQVMTLNDGDWSPGYEKFSFAHECTELLAEGSKAEVDAKLSEAATHGCLEGVAVSSGTVGQ